MAKDPAFLFYTGDFSTGTQFFTDEQVGKYLRLLMAQHQHGHLTEKQMLQICKSYDNDVFEKFTKDPDGKFFQPRLEEEILKRRNFTESRSKNKLGKTKSHDIHIKNKSKTYEKRMDNENKNEDIIEVDIWVNGCELLKNDYKWFTEEIEMKFQLPESELNHRLEQYWLSIQKSNFKGGLNQIRAGFIKWIKTWNENEKKNNNGNKQQTRKGQPDIDNILSASAEILRQHNLKNNGTGD